MSDQAISLVDDPDRAQAQRADRRRRALRWAFLIGSRLGRLVAVLLLVSLATLVMLDLLPGGPAEAILGASASPEQVEALNEQLGVNDPLHERYWDWITGVATADLGRSTFTSQPVADIITARLPVTIQLAVGTLILALALSIPAAVYAASHPRGWFSRIVSSVDSAVLAIPSFIMAVLLIYLLALRFPIFPVLGWVPLTQDVGENLRHAFLPIVSLALLEGAIFTRVLRNDMASTLREDFILAARARGLPRRRILFGHALRPSSFSLITVAGVSLGRLIGGTIIVETLFVLPGLGQAVISAIAARDYITIRGIIVVVSIGYVVVNAVVDLVYQLLDPRVRAAHTP